jgi:anti-sigma regulatory factor (Ser/Thr protein kinase)
MPGSVRIPIEEPSQPAEARRIAARMAHEIGFNEVRAGAVAIVVTEAGTNILKYAEHGEILLRVTECEAGGSDRKLEMLALDRGPGMRNLDRCLRDGYTTASSPGQGLGAIQRLSDESDFYTVPGEGTAILARWAACSPSAVENSAAQALQIDAVSVSKYGQEVCGDCWGVVRSGAVSTVLVADGLGHGYEASLASSEAVRILREHRDLLPAALIDLSHRALRSLRGAAVAVARIDSHEGQVTFSGVGNVMAQICSGSRRMQNLVSVNGTAGQHIQRIREFTYPWPADGLLVIHTDGLSTGAGLETHQDLSRHDPGLIAGVLYRLFSRGHDDATVVVVKAAVKAG